MMIVSSKYILKEIRRRLYKLLYGIRKWHVFLKTLPLLERPTLIFNTEDWHFMIDYSKRKEKYRTFLEEKGHKVTCIDLNSKYMVFILDIVLNGITKTLPISSINSYLKSKTSMFFWSQKYSYWDLILRSKKLDKINLVVSSHKYRNIFYLFTDKNCYNRSIWNGVLNIFNNSNVQGVILTQQAYEELPIARSALDSNIEVIYFEALNGIEILNPSKFSMIDKYSKAFDLSIGALPEEYLKRHDDILSKRIQGKEISERIFLRDTSREVNPNAVYSSHNWKSSRIICLYLHCFTDSPNWLRDTEGYSPFVDFYEMSLYIIEYCSENGIPLIIKPHPEADAYPKDKKFMNSLIDVVNKSKKNFGLRVEWVDDNFTFDQLIKLDNPVVVTGRGTVVTECGYCGVPAITFFESPWCNLKNLSFLVKSTNDFSKVLLSIDKAYSPELAKKEAIILSAMLDRGFNRHAFKIEKGSKTGGDRSIEEMWNKKEVL